MRSQDNRLRRCAKAAAMVIGCFAFIQCDRTAVFNPEYPDQAEFRVFHLGTYSSKLDEEKEREGTIFQTTNSFTLEKQGPGWKLHRKLDTLMARGYHKFSMPHELEKKIDLDIYLDSGFIPERVDGYDSIKSVLGRIQQKEDYRKQLLEGSDTAAYKAEWRDFWRMNMNTLPRGVELVAGDTLPVAELNKTLETIKADSARFVGHRPRFKKLCLDYNIFYNRTDSLPLLMEQFYFSAIQNRKYRKYGRTPALITGILQYSVEEKTGMPCFHSKSEIGKVIIEMKEEKSEIPVYLLRYEEELYEF